MDKFRSVKFMSLFGFWQYFEIEKYRLLRELLGYSRFFFFFNEILGTRFISFLKEFSFNII